jgi:hypothetical protein
MRGGDLSADSAPSIVFLWEGCIATVHTDDYKHYAKAVRKKRYDDAIALAVPNDPLLQRIWRVERHYDLNFYLASFLPAAAKPALERWVDEHHLPFSWVYCVTPDQLSRELASDPSIEALYVGDEKVGVWMGSKVRHIRYFNLG